MELNIYSSEKFERSKWRYTIFACVFVLIIIVSIIYKNIAGLILMFFLMGGYIYYGLLGVQETKAKITDHGLLIGTRLYVRPNIVGYSAEINKDDQQVKNLVILRKNSHSIYTIKDTPENIDSFFSQLNEFVPMSGEFTQSSWEKLARKLKL